MKNYCVDTNAILDLCYRYYPKATFNHVWQALQQAVVARQIKLHITEHIYNEVQAKILQFNYDKVLFELFLDELNICIISFDEYEQELSELKADIASVNERLIKSLSKNDNDLSNICIMKNKGGVITAEQGSKISIDNPIYERLKIPDVAKYFNVSCQNWLPVLTYIGFSE